MTGILGKQKLAAAGVMIAAALAMPFAASAHGWGHGRGHGYYGGYHGYHGGYYHGGYHREGHWEGGRWIAGALVAGAMVGLIDAAVNPRPVYYDAPVVYTRPRTTVIYEDRPVVERRVVTRTVVYSDPYDTRYVRDDGYDDDGD
ncbi:MAG TPA: hypothetical protein VFR91_10765 [Dyella sp.]|nr:hypothetical protein [Dyella sp.]